MLVVHPKFEGLSPRGIYKLVKGGELTRDELVHAYESAFPCFDPEEPDHALLFTTVRIKIEELDFAEKQTRDAKTEEEKAVWIEAGKKYAKDNGLDPEILSEQVLIEIGSIVDNPVPVGAEEEESVEILRKDEEEMLLVTPSGNIVAFLDAPVVDDREKLLEWVGERMTSLDAGIAGLTAEKEVWTKKINAIYDPQINAQNRKKTGLNWVYGPMARAYLEEIVDRTKGTKKPVRSVKIGLLKLAMTKTRESLDVIMDTKAVTWLRKQGLHDAVKVTESVVKGEVPVLIRKQINEDPESGMRLNVGGEDKFIMS